jgi:hypothetical protein
MEIVLHRLVEEPDITLIPSAAPVVIGAILPAIAACCANAPSEVE